MARSVTLSAYLLFARNSNWLAMRKLAKRVASGFEDPTRVSERLGKASRPRPEGLLIWIHTTNAVENKSILELARRLQDAKPHLNFMITTGDASNVKAPETDLPSEMVHQYVPLDMSSAVNSFLDHWRPDLAIWSDTAFMPALVHETHKRETPMLLINARMSAKSYRRWRSIRGMASSILGRFDTVLAQDTLTAHYLQSLGVPSNKVQVSGSLKEGAAPLKHNEMERKALAGAINGRTVWLAASTHPGEEEMILKAHRIARRSFPELMLILAPRHPERGDELAEKFRSDSCVITQRSKGQEITNRTDIYLVDTIGEMGLWYRLAPVSFIGGSFAPIGGHNPFEPAALGSAILHGPQVYNFKEAYDRLTDVNACISVADEQELARVLEATLEPERAALLATAAWKACSDGADVTDKVLQTLSEYLPKAIA
ncbi:MAG: 3-deoxy-D-manno-octulosonic acid transferase [Alphaproteobacteria bacterium]